MCFTCLRTDGEGGKTYGFCRRVLPKANHVDVSSKRYPVALCIMSRFPWFTPFFTALRTMDSLFRDIDLKCLESPEPKLSKVGRLRSHDARLSKPFSEFTPQTVAFSLCSDLKTIAVDSLPCRTPLSTNF